MSQIHLIAASLSVSLRAVLMLLLKRTSGEKSYNLMVCDLGFCPDVIVFTFNVQYYKLHATDNVACCMSISHEDIITGRNTKYTQTQRAGLNVNMTDTCDGQPTCWTSSDTLTFSEARMQIKRRLDVCVATVGSKKQILSSMKALSLIKCQLNRNWVFDCVMDN